MKICDDNTCATAGLAGKSCSNLCRQLADLGLSLSLWDHLGQAAGEINPAGEFCRTLWAGGLYCDTLAQETARRVIDEDAARVDVAPCGGMLLGVPLRRRRRILGVAVACCPTFQSIDEEAMGRLCARFALDGPIVVGLARGHCRHSSQQAEDLLKVVEWMVDREQSASLAQEELATLSSNLSSTYEELSLLYRISGAMSVTQQPSEFLRGVCGDLMDVMNLSSACAVVLHPDPNNPQVVQTGQCSLSGEQLLRLARMKLLPRLAAMKQPLVDNRVADAHAPGVSRLVAAPLVVGDATAGLLLGLDRPGSEFDSADLKLIGSIGSQASVFLTNSKLYADLQDLLMGVLHALTATIDAKDPYTCGHSRRVAMLSERLAKIYGLGDEKAGRIYLCGLLHDIGKIGVPEATLRKPGRLTDDEFDELKKHPALGAHILGGIRQLDDVIAGIRTHHERPDGRGYPQGLPMTELPIEGLIVGLADSFDAMTSDRTYRKALPLEVVVEEIRKNADKQFHPDLVEALLDMDLPTLLEELRNGTRAPMPAQLQGGRL